MSMHPNGYGTQLLDLEGLERLHGPMMHPEFRRRLFNWLGARPGFGIGGGYRSIGSQPDRAGFAPEGKSFHQLQLFASGLYMYAAVDLVVAVSGARHRSPTWSEVPAQGTDAAVRWGVHCNVGIPPTGESWHMQPVEIDGYDRWIRNGRPDPAAGYPIPTDPPPAHPQEDVIYVTVITVHQGDTGHDVERLQRLLPLFNIDPGTPDGRFGPRTDTAVRLFQQRSGLVVDGYVGPRTWAALYS